MAIGNDYDYTKGDSVPFGSPDDDLDAFELPSAAAPVRTAEDIEKENSFREIPAGDQILVVAGLAEAPSEDHHRVQMPDGTIGAFVSYSIRVKFHLPNDPRATISDFFVVPPADPGHLAAYFDGIEPNKSGQYNPNSKGLAASKFYHFLGRLGFPYAPGENLPPAATKVSNWKGRAIIATVVEGNEYVGRDGKPKKGRNQIKFFSYRQTPGSAANYAAAGGGAGASAGQPTGGGRAASAAVAAAPGASNRGLDDI